MLIITFQNIKTENDIADYKWMVYINREVIAHGYLNNHFRPDGWRKLLKQWVDNFGKL